MRKLLIGLLLSLFIFPAVAAQYHPVDKHALPESKRTKLELYLSAPEAYAMKSKAGEKALFIDVRTKGEFMFLGSPSVTDMNIPYMDIDDPTSWDKKGKHYTMAPNSDFVAAVAALVAQHHLGKNDPIIVMCRSGDRSSRAADLLQKDGYTKVYSVVDGFEGDMDTNGKRDLNGWKNANLPWTYDMKESQAYLR